MDCVIAFESLLYYLSICFLSVYLFGAVLKNKSVFLVSLMLYFPAVFSFFLDLSEGAIAFFNIFYMSLPIILSLLLLSKIRIKSLIFIILFVYIFSFALASDVLLIAGLFYDNEFVKIIVDLIINTIIFSVYLVVCKSPLRFSIAKPLLLLSTKVKVITLFSLCISGYLASLFLDLSFIQISNKWVFIIKLFASILILIIGITCPLLIANAFSSSYYKAQSQVLKNQVENQVKYYKKLSQKNYEISKFRHDYKNVNITLSKLLSNNDIEGAKDFLDNQSEYFNVINESSFLFDTGNDIADALFSEKQTTAKKSEVDISFDGMIPKEKISAEDICIIFGNAIDNAIEACEKINDSKNKIISIISKQRANFLKIVISNPINSQVKLNDGLPITTKEDKSQHGFGLYSINESVKKYNGEMKIITGEDTFSLEIYMNI